jgi:EAL domain-containing protein (putative c-di-GMP-specific phosphodiesterase class I)
MIFVDTITRLGHRLGMKVVAEGIECSESWRRLADAGCDMGQGYHISRPLPSEMMTGWLRSSAQHEWKNIG